jgi:transposase
VTAARQAWPGEVAGVDPGDLLFVDETGAGTALHRTHGYAPRGERIDEAVPHGHWKVVTFWGALTAGGLVAPWAQAEPMTGAVFEAWVEQILAPQLRPGQVVVMDNLACHKVAGVRRAIEAAGCRLLYLPPYSPDLNPIENWFAKFKARLRTAAARTVDGVYEAMREALDRLTPSECIGYLRHCGYASGQAT